MNREQVALLLAKATAAYPKKAPDFKGNPQIFELWVERLRKVDPEQALRNLNHHIDNDKFFPDISDITKENQIDIEIESRNHDIAFSQFVRGGGKPEDFIYVRDRAAGVKELGS